MFHLQIIHGYRVETEEEKIDRHFNNLEELFPDTDPEFLHARAGDLYADEKLFQEFIVEGFETKAKNFPTRKQYEKRREVRMTPSLGYKRHLCKDHLPYVRTRDLELFCAALTSIQSKVYSVNVWVQGDTSRCFKPPVDIKTKVLFWPGQVRVGQALTRLLI